MNHSTILNLYRDHCPRAVDHYYARVPYDRSVFEVGIAAHAILEAVGHAVNKAGGPLSDEELDRVSRRVCEALIDTGRSFEGTPEPPLVPDNVFKGRDVALEWLWTHPIETPGSHYEIGLSVDAKWQPLDEYHKSDHWKAILDVVTPEWDEEGRLGLTIRDYKGWSGSADDLWSLQGRGQAVLVYLHALNGRWGEGGEAPTHIRREVVNLRTRKTYSDTLWLGSEDGTKTLEEWRLDIESTLKIDAKRKGKRPATPGAGCHGCPYILACDEAQDYLERRAIAGVRTLRQRAILYTVAEATIKALRPELQKAASEAPIEMGDGHGKLGYWPQGVRFVKDGAHRKVAEEWEIRGGGDVSSLLHHLKLTTSNLDAFAKATMDTPEERDTWLSDLVTTAANKRFGVVKE